MRQLCNRLLGGDRIGQVGYDSLPPLVQDVYDRLAPLGITPKTRRVTRVLMDFTADPDKRAASRLLWRLNWLCPNTRVARPIMGELALGKVPRQESWDVALHGADQRAVIQLSFEGVTVEQVLERRLARDAWGSDASTVGTLAAIEASLILLQSPRLTASLGHRAVELLSHEIGADSAPEIFERARVLVHHHRTTAEGVPDWLMDFVATGYRHYTTQLPEGFGDRGTRPEELAAMLSFVFTLEGLALAMGCNRSQLVIAVEHAATQASEPEKLGLLWATEWLVQHRDDAGVHRAFSEILDHPLGRMAYPRYLSGFLAALGFAPGIGPMGVALLGRAFTELPDHVLLPWMPALLQELRPRSVDVLPALFTEVMRTLPRNLDALDAWTPPWDAAAPAPPAPAAPGAPTGDAAAARQLLGAFPATTDGFAAVVGATDPWGDAPAATSSGAGPSAIGADPAVAALVARHPAAAEAFAAWIGG